MDSSAVGRRESTDLRVTIDFTPALGDRTGVGTYTRELVRALLGLPGRPALRLAAHVFRHPGWHGKMSRRLGTRSGWRPAPSRLLPPGAVLESCHRIGLPRVEDLFGNCDVFHGTNFIALPARRARTVVTVHDLAFLRFAAEIPVPHRYARWVPEALRRADHVIAVSRATERDVVEICDVDPARVSVVPEAPAPLGPAAPRSEILALLARHGIPPRFFLFLGTLEPRKNLVRLVEAWRRARPDLPEETGLVLAGRRGWSEAPLLAALRRARAEGPAAWIGFGPGRVRHALYREALAFVFPSLYEGFGLPVLEAFAAGTPVICSDRGALPETAGNAALLVDPEDGGALADALRRIAADPALRSRLAARGRLVVAAFDWTRTARETLRIYRRLPGSRPGHA